MQTAKDNYRVPGEFEKQASVLMMWPLGSYVISTGEMDRDAVAVETVRNLQGSVRIIVSCFDKELKSRAMAKLKAADISTDNIDFVAYPCRIIYPRDFGAEVMVDNQGNRLYVDFANTSYGASVYGAPLARSMENFDKFHANYLGIKDARFSRLVSEGGDREFNGQGVMMAIEETEVAKRNPGWSKEEVEAEFKRLFNLSKILWLPRGTYDDESVYLGPIPDENNEYKAYRSASANGHIDEMCRFVSEDTIMLAEITVEEAEQSELHKLNKERLDEAFEVLKASTTADGKPFNIIRIPVPEPLFVNLNPDDYLYRIFESGSKEYNGIMLDGSPFPDGTIKVMPALSYCNFLIANDVVIAQKYYKEGMPLAIKEKDQQALSVLQSVFPDRRVVAIDSIALNMHGGGIHCNTRNVPSARP